MAVIWTHQAHWLNGLIWQFFLNPRPIETTPVVSCEGERRWYKHDIILKIQVQYDYETLSFTYRFTDIYIIYKFLQHKKPKFGNKKVYPSSILTKSVHPANSRNYSSGSTTTQPSTSRRINLAQQWQKSTWEVPVINLQQSPEQLILRKTYPPIGYT